MFEGHDVNDPLLKQELASMIGFKGLGTPFTELNLINGQLDK